MWNKGIMQNCNYMEIQTLVLKFPNGFSTDQLSNIATMHILQKKNLQNYLIVP